MSKIHILTLTHNGKDRLEKLAPSLFPALSVVDYCWYVQERNSKDNSAEYLASFNNPNIQIIQYPNNQQNFSEGCNFLFNAAQPKDDDYVMLLNNDIIFNDTTSIKTMVDLMENDPDIGMVGSRLLYTGTNKLQHAGCVFVKKYNTPTHFRAGQESDLDSQKNREFQAITGACCITKAKYYRQANTNNPSGINGMEERLKWAFCDTDLSMNIKYNIGKKIVYCGSTNISHEESASLKKNPVNKLFLSHNLSYFLTKWKGRYEIDFDAYMKDKNKGLYYSPNKVNK